MNFRKITSNTSRLAFLSALTVMAIISVSQHAAAQLVIDDFSSGFYTKSLSTGTATDTQTGTMAGDSRLTILTVCEPTNPCTTDPYEQPNSYQIKKATKTTANILIFNTGYKSDASLEVVYGDGNPMSLNLSPAYDRIRLYFDSADGGGVNMNINVNSGAETSSLGCNFNDPNGPQGAFTVDFPFANFIGDADFSNITAIGFSFNGAQGLYTGEDWGITSIQAVDGVTGNPIICGSSGDVSK
jgi:hypothetical protein